MQLKSFHYSTLIIIAILSILVFLHNDVLLFRFLLITIVIFWLMVVGIQLIIQLIEKYDNE
jgi:hypothetical protein